jgi:hypothetical protein
MTIGTEIFLHDSLENAIRENPEYASGVIHARVYIVNGKIVIEDLEPVIKPAKKRKILKRK